MLCLIFVAAQRKMPKRNIVWLRPSVSTALKTGLILWCSQACLEMTVCEHNSQGLHSIPTFCQIEGSSDNFMVSSRRWSCITLAHVHISGCQFELLFSELGAHPSKQRLYFIESTDPDSIYLCIYYFPIVAYLSCECTLLPSTVIWLVTSVDLDPENLKTQAWFGKNNNRCPK